MTSEIWLHHRGTERTLFILAGLMALPGLGFAFGILSGGRRASDQGSLMVLGLVLIAFAALLGFYAFKLSKTPQKGIRLTSSGIFDPQMMKAEVPWAKVMGAGVVVSGGREVFAIALKEKMPSNRLFYTKWLAALDGNPGFGYRKFLFEKPIAEMEQDFNNATMDLGAMPDTRLKPGT